MYIFFHSLRLKWNLWGFTLNNSYWIHKGKYTMCYSRKRHHRKYIHQKLFMNLISFPTTQTSYSPRKAEMRTMRNMHRFLIIALMFLPKFKLPAFTSLQSRLTRKLCSKGVEVTLAIVFYFANWPFPLKLNICMIMFQF